MKKIRVTHKDGDMQGITLIYLVNKYLKINRELWDKEGMVLNRYYKAILTRTIKASDKIVNKFKNQINYRVEKDVIKILDEVFAECGHTETGDNLELLRTMFLVIMMLGTINFHKRNMIGVVLKSMITDVVNAFEDFKVMWLREIDDSVVRLEEASAC
jgi:dynein heavy chain 2